MSGVADTYYTLSMSISKVFFQDVFPESTLQGGTQMVRATYETAGVLRDLYNEEFGGDEYEPYQIGWDQLRGIAGVERG